MNGENLKAEYCTTEGEKDGPFMKKACFVNMIVESIIAPPIL